MLRPLDLLNNVRRFALLALFVLACSCGGHVRASEYARMVINEQLPEEDSIERICARASGAADGTGKEGLAKARDHAQRQARDVLCHALECGEGKPCECTGDGLEIRFHAQIALTATQKNVLASLGARKGLSFENAWQEAQEALSRRTAAEWLDRLNLSRAGLVVLLRLADEVQSVADAIAASFGWFQGFAQPLLRRVAAETVAAAMDAVVDEMTAHAGLPHADLTRQACGFYARRDPRASVGDRLLRRLILRFAPSDVLEKIGKGKQSECDRLEAAADFADRGVCKRIRQEVALDAEVVPLPRQPALESQASESRMKAQGQSFARMATSCFVANPGDPMACSADRVTSAASYVYILSVYDPVDPGAGSRQLVPFTQVEERLVAMENEIARLRGEVREIGAGRAWHERVDEDLVRLLREQAAQIQKLEEGTAFFARLASERCKKEYDDARRKRSQLAKELGLGDRFCSEVKSGEVRSGPPNASFSVDPVAFCRPNSPIRLTLQWDFAGCDFALGAEQKKALEKLGSITSKEVFVVNGYASRRAPSQACFKVAERAGLPASEEPRSMAKYGVTSPDRSPVHAGLSFLRALVVAEAMAAGMGRTANRTEMEAVLRTRFELKPWGASQASRECDNEADSSKQEECFKRDQRVELEARLDEYMFHIEGCP